MIEKKILILNVVLLFVLGIICFHSNRLVSLNSEFSKYSNAYSAKKCSYGTPDYKDCEHKFDLAIDNIATKSILKSLLFYINTFSGLYLFYGLFVVYLLFKRKRSAIPPSY